MNHSILKKFISTILTLCIVISTLPMTGITASASSAYDFIVSTEASETEVELGQSFSYSIKIKPYNYSDPKYFNSINLTLNPEDGFSISDVTTSNSRVTITKNYSTGVYRINFRTSDNCLIESSCTLATVTMSCTGGEGYYNVTSKTLSVSPNIYRYHSGTTGYDKYTYGTDFATVNFYKGCGENLTWSLTKSGTLTISGTGAMRNYSYDAPWGKNIKNVIINNGVTSIGDYSFRNCSSLESVTIPESVNSIGTGAFMGCTNLTNIDIPSKVTTIGASAFRECTGIKEIEIPNGVKELSWCILMDCTGLEKITLPASITELGYCAMKGCTSLTDIYYEGTESEWNNIKKTDGWDEGTYNEYGTYELHFKQPETIAVTEVSLNKTSTTLTIGGTETLTASILPSNATNKNVVWTSANENVATVSNGVVTAVGKGSTIIVAMTEDGNKTALCTVNVISNVDVSGSVKSFGDATKDVTVELLSNGEVVDTKTVTGNSGTYSFEDVEKGVYTVRVSKTKHAPREYEITVADEDVTQDVEIWLYGDVTADGTVNSTDILQFSRKIANLSSMFNQTANQDYRFKVANLTKFTTGDDLINSADLLQISRKVANLSSIFDRIA